MNIISAENYKLKKDKSLRIMIVICAVCFFSFGFLMKLMQDVTATMGAEMGEAADALALLFPVKLSGMNSPFLLTQFYNVITICCGVFAGTFIVGEFDKGTIRNALTTGTSKTAYYFSKLYAQIIFCLFLTLVSTLAFVASTTIAVGWGGSFDGNYPLSLLVFMCVMFIQFLSYSALFQMVAFLVRNIGGVIGICIAWVTFESLIPQILMLANNSVLTKIAENLPYSILANLTQFAGRNAVLTADFAKGMISAIIIIAVAVPVGLVNFIKRDVK